MPNIRVFSNASCNGTVVDTFTARVGTCATHSISNYSVGIVLDEVCILLSRALYTGRALYIGCGVAVTTVGIGFRKPRILPFSPAFRKTILQKTGFVRSHQGYNYKEDRLFPVVSSSNESIFLQLAKSRDLRRPICWTCQHFCRVRTWVTTAARFGL